MTYFSFEEYANDLFNHIYDDANMHSTPQRIPVIEIGRVGRPGIQFQTRAMSPPPPFSYKRSMEFQRSTVTISTHWSLYCIDGEMIYVIRWMKIFILDHIRHRTNQDWIGDHIDTMKKLHERWYLRLTHRDLTRARVILEAYDAWHDAGMPRVIITIIDEYLGIMNFLQEVHVIHGIHPDLSRSIARIDEELTKIEARGRVIGLTLGLTPELTLGLTPELTLGLTLKRSI